MQEHPDFVEFSVEAITAVVATAVARTATTSKKEKEPAQLF